MNSEVQIIDNVVKRLMVLGYAREDIFTEYQIGNRRRADILVKQNERPYFVVEVKKPSISIGKELNQYRFDPAIRQVQSHAQYLKIEYYLFSNGKDYLWFKNDTSGRPILLEEPILPIRKIIPKKEYSKSIKSALFQLQSFLFIEGGLTSNYEVSLIIYAKMLEELGDPTFKNQLLTNSDNVDFFKKYLPNKNILNGDLLYRAFRIIENVELTNPKNRDDVLEIINSLAIKNKTGGLIIPLQLSDFIAELTDLKPGEKVLDMGAYFGNMQSAIFKKHKNVSTTTLYLNEENRYWIKIHQLVTKGEEDAIYHSSTPPFEMLDKLPINHFDKIVITPSFSRNVRLNYDSELLQAGSRDITGLYFELALKWLKPNGKIISIIPEHFLFSNASAKARKYILDYTQIKAIISLPSGTFRPIAGVKTSIIVVEKTKTNENYSILFGELKGDAETKKGSNFDTKEAKKLIDNFKGASRGVKPEITKYFIPIPSKEFGKKDFAIGDFKLNFYKDTSNSFNEFPLVPLLEIAHLIRRGVPIKLDKNGNQLIIGPKSIRPLTINNEDFDVTVQDNIPKNAPKTKKGDVLINAISTYRGSAGVIDDTLEDYVFSQHLILIRPKIELINPNFLSTVFRSKYFKDQIELLSTGGVIKSISLRSLRKVSIPLPSINHQNEIVKTINEKKYKH